MNATMLIEMLTHTPWWVYMVFGYLMIVGLQGTKRRTIYLPIVFTVPTIFTALKLATISAETILPYCLALAMGAMLGIALEWQTKMHIDKNSTSITLPGSWSMFTLILLIFGVKYFFGYKQATSVNFQEQYGYMETVAVGITTGIFWGRAVLYTWRYTTS